VSVCAESITSNSCRAAMWLFCNLRYRRRFQPPRLSTKRWLVCWLLPRKRKQLLMPNVMEMKKINSGRLRAIGYDARARMLQVQLDDGSMLQYGGVGEVSGSGAAWSFYRDNIEEEFTAKRVSGSAPAGNNPLDELFRKP